MATARLKDTNLTQQNEVFAVFLSLGHSQLDAYKLAYPNQAKGSKTSTLAPHASRLANDDKVVARVRQLRDAITSDLGVDDKRLIAEWATVAFDQVDEPLTWQAKTKALSELSARLWPVPKEPAQPPVTNNTLILQGYSVEQLRALLGATQGKATT